MAAIKNGNLRRRHLPAVSFFKAAGYQDAHAGYSDPIDEQEFVVSDDQLARSAADLVEHGRRGRLRRLRWMVRPRVQRHHNASTSFPFPPTRTSDWYRAMARLVLPAARPAHLRRLLPLAGHLALANFVARTLSDQSSI